MESVVIPVTLLVFLLVMNCSASDKLVSMNVDHDKITLSGFSSGGTFAQMMQFSYSSMFSGIAVFSHTYYRCGLPDGNVDNYDRDCTKLFNLTERQFYDVDKVHDDIRQYEERNLIEPTSNLKTKRLYVYSGTRNALFTLSQSLGILSVYQKYILSMENIFTRVQDANLVLPTNSELGLPCTQFDESKAFIGNCGFSGVTEAINFLLFGYKDPSDAFNIHSTRVDKVSEFDQTEFTRDLNNHQLDDIGYYYVPKSCKSSYYKKCYLHFYFHGCASGREFKRALPHIENSGLLQVAERKGIIMIFPQAKSTKKVNDIGCWDTYGISGKYYATQEGPQIRAVKRILDKVLGRSSSSSGSYFSGYYNRGYGSSSSSNGKGNGNNNNNYQNGHPSLNYHRNG